MTSAQPNETPKDARQAIGYIIGGGLKANYFVRLTVPAQSVQEGGFVVIESGDWLFYGLVTDLQPGFAGSTICRRNGGAAAFPASIGTAQRADPFYQPGSAASLDVGTRARPG